MGQISKVTNNILNNEVNSFVTRTKYNYYIQTFTKLNMDMKNVGT